MMSFHLVSFPEIVAFFVGSPQSFNCCRCRQFDSAMCIGEGWEEEWGPAEQSGPYSPNETAFHSHALPPREDSLCSTDKTVHDSHDGNVQQHHAAVLPSTQDAPRGTAVAASLLKSECAIFSLVEVFE